MSTLISRAHYAFRLIVDPRERRVRRWFAVNGDETLRLDYSLAPDSTVFDVGGYEGEWAAAIAARYHPIIHVFEPVGPIHQAISARFAGNPHIHVWPFGLAGADGTSTITLAGNRSSIHHGYGEMALAQLRSFCRLRGHAGH